MKEIFSKNSTKNKDVIVTICYMISICSIIMFMMTDYVISHKLYSTAPDKINIYSEIFLNEIFYIQKNIIFIECTYLKDMCDYIDIVDFSQNSSSLFLEKLNIAAAMSVLNVFIISISPKRWWKVTIVRIENYEILRGLNVPIYKNRILKNGTLIILVSLFLIYSIFNNIMPIRKLTFYDYLIQDCVLLTIVFVSYMISLYVRVVFFMKPVLDDET